MIRIVRLLPILFACLVQAQSVELPPTTPAGAVLQTLIGESRLEEIRWPDFSDYRHHLRNYYGAGGYELAWIRDGKPTPQAYVVIALLQAADTKGISAADYDGPRWGERLTRIEGGATDEELARFDLALTVATMRYISDLHIGRINPRNVKFDLDIESKKYYLPSLLREVKGSAAPAWVLSSVEPPHPEYRRLRDALVRYKTLAADDHPRLESASVKPGETYRGLRKLAERLQLLGDLDATATIEGTAYQEPVVTAVKRFQRRHNLDDDGNLGPATIHALNVPLQQRVRQLELALERWRWAPTEFAQPPIIVNIPEFRLHAWDAEGKTALTMRVVVGQSYGHQTPIFAGDMRYIVLRPYWNVPPSIQRNEIVPKLSGDHSYLARNQYEIVDKDGKPVGDVVTDDALARLTSGDLRLRQKPGPSNALGLVKFMFPNDNNVYLHSTPAQTLFARSRRDFSHGCIRVEDPVTLAAWVLRDKPEWTPDAIRTAMNGGQSTTVVLDAEIPVLIIYATAHAEESGEVFFFEDIYGHDVTLENALAAGYPYPR